MTTRTKRCIRIKRIIAFTASLLLAMICMMQGVGGSMSVLGDTIHQEYDPPLTYVDLDYGFTEEEQESNSFENSISAFSLEAEMATPQSLPVSYGVSESGELADWLPDLRNQYSFGNCWAFSALGASETGLIRKGYAGNQIDLSERQLTYYFFNKGADIADPKKGVLGDHNMNITKNSYWNIGGNSLLTIWHMASWCGPVLESLAPMSASVNLEDTQGLLGQKNSEQMAYGNDAYHLQNAYVLPIGESYHNEDQKNSVKRFIMQYGALGMSYYAEKTTGGYDNLENDCYYNDEITKTNHAIQVVGWDDQFSKENFNEEHRPPEDGAWLMKNSWGAEGGKLGQNGYFWLSYYDYSLRNTPGSTVKYAYVYDCEPADNYDVIYQHDGDAGHKRLEIASEVGSLSTYSCDVKKAANVFSVSSNETENQFLEAVGIGESKMNVPYELAIYVNPTDEKDPTSGTLKWKQEGVILYNGYHTIPLQKRIELAPGDVYSVVFTFDEEPGYVYASRNLTLSPWQFIAQNSQGDSFYMQPGSQNWEDCAASTQVIPSALRIKAYCNYESKITLDENAVILDQAGDTAVVSASSISANQLEGLNWRSSDEKIASIKKGESVSSNQVEIVALAEGYCQVEARNQNGKTAVCHVRVGQFQEENYMTWERAQQIEDKKDGDGQAGTPIEKDPLQEDPGKVEQKPQTPLETGVQKPAKVTKLTAAVEKKRKTTLTWKKQSKVDGYQIARASSSMGEFKKIKTLSGAATTSYRTTAYFTENGRSKAYYFKVRAYRVVDGKKVYGDWSGVRSIAPTQEKIVSVKKYTKKIRLTYQRSIKANGYHIYRRLNGKGSYRLYAVVKGRNNTVFMDRRDPKVSIYEYKVCGYRSVNGVHVEGTRSKKIKIKF